MLSQNEIEFCVQSFYFTKNRLILSSFSGLWILSEPPKIICTQIHFIILQTSSVWFICLIYECEVLFLFFFVFFTFFMFPLFSFHSNFL